MTTKRLAYIRLIQALRPAKGGEARSLEHESRSHLPNQIVRIRTHITYFTQAVKMVNTFFQIE